MLEKVCNIMRRVLEVDEGTEISVNTAMEDIPEWDSFGQLALLSELQQEFEIKFTWEEMIEINSVASILGILEKRKG